MALIQRTIFLLFVAAAFAASLPDTSLEDFSDELELDSPLSKNSYNSNIEKSDGQITEYDPISPSFIVSDQSESNGFEMGKSLVGALLGVLQIVRQMDLSQEGLKNVSLFVARMLATFAGQYLETLKKLMPLFSGIAMAILETLRQT